MPAAVDANLCAQKDSLPPVTVKPIRNKVVVVLGAQWGDEGKGKVTDMLAEKADIVCRYQGGNNADHAVVVNNEKYIFHLFPAGMMNKNCKVVLGNGVVISIPELFSEGFENEKRGLTWWRENLIISDRAHVVFNFHQKVDCILEEMRGEKMIGTTKKGIGPTYTCKLARDGIRISELMGSDEVFEERFTALVNMYRKLYSDLEIDLEAEMARYKKLREDIRPMVKDSVYFLHDAMHSKEPKNIVIEGANAVGLDIDFGTYPYVTSSNCSIGGVCTGLGIPPSGIDEVIGIIKTFTTRMGGGPFPTEQLNEIGDKFRNIGKEYGGTTGRAARCGWLDLVITMYSHVLNNFTCLAVTKLDILDKFKEIKIGVAYKYKGETLTKIPASLEVLQNVEVEYVTIPGWMTNTNWCRKFSDLPPNAQLYIRKIEEILQIPVKWVGIGKGRNEMIQLY